MNRSQSYWATDDLQAALQAWQAEHPGATVAGWVRFLLARARRVDAAEREVAKLRAELARVLAGHQANRRA